MNNIKAAYLGLQPLLPGRGASFRPKHDIPSLASKTILITGGAHGIGKATVAYLVRGQPAEIWVADLDRATTAKVIAELRKSSKPGPTFHALHLDLSSLDAVRAAVAHFLAIAQRLDLLICNAGILPNTMSKLTADGFEPCFAVNYLGHALLTHLLLPLLRATASAHGDARIIAISSAGHGLHPPGGIVFEHLRTPCSSMSALQRYGQSKLAVLLWARELAAREPYLSIASLHPGNVRTRGATEWSLTSVQGVVVTVMMVPFMPLVSVSAARGSWNTVWAATAEKRVLGSGRYYAPVGAKGYEFGLAAQGSKEGEKLSRRLWQWTEDELTSLLAGH